MHMSAIQAIDVGLVHYGVSPSFVVASTSGVGTASHTGHCLINLVNVTVSY